MSRIFVKPAPGKVLYNPATGKPVPDTGAHVPDTSYWRRRIKEGGAFRSSSAAARSAAAKPDKPETEKPASEKTASGKIGSGNPSQKGKNK